ncbi:MAG: hypothetical protein KGL39_29860 [Patescibacteria group bacterium]|nr:hypothetical protein [Patescibacteria group bacterium]
MTGKRIDHIRQLADSLGVKLNITKGLGTPNGSAEGSGEVRVRNWRGDLSSYFVALHELGHFAMQHVGRDPELLRRNYAPRRLEAESEAWLWALKQAQERPSRKVQDRIRTEWLGSYASARNTFPLGESGPAFSQMQFLGLVPRRSTSSTHSAQCR